MNADSTSPFELDPDRVATASGEPALADDIPSPIGPLELPIESVHQHPGEKPSLGAANAKPPRIARRAIKIFLAAVAILVVGILAVETVSYILALFQRNSVIGALLGGVAVAVFTSGIVAVGWEALAVRRQLRGLHEVAELRERATRVLREPANSNRGGALASRVISRYEDRPELADCISQFKITVTSAHSDGEILSLIAQQILRPLDDRAYGIVSRAARDAGIGVLLSPAGLLDAALVMWRTSRMIRDVALVYGFSPSRIARFMLVRRVLENAAMAGALEYLGDLLTAHIGAGIAGRLSNKFGQGAFTSLRTARLGLIAIEACRPIPFTVADRASLGTLLKDILKPFATRSAKTDAQPNQAHPD